MIMIMVKILNELHDIFHLQKGQITFWTLVICLWQLAISKCHNTGDCSIPADWQLDGSIKSTHCTTERPSTHPILLHNFKLQNNKYVLCSKSEENGLQDKAMTKAVAGWSAKQLIYLTKWSVVLIQWILLLCHGHYSWKGICIFFVALYALNKAFLNGLQKTDFKILHSN